MELAENVVIANRFKLIRMIGRGGMGSVWRAFDQNLNTDCAIKFIEGDIANLAEAHARFKREAHAAAQLRSPHIVQIFDHNIFEGVPYLAMELLDGEDLGHVLARQQTVQAPEVIRIVQQVCRALGKAHEKGIVHRDLKPDNIFLVKDEDGPIAKVVDFGIAKLQANPMDLGGGTKTGSLLGTPYYMSPEQAQGTKSVDSRSDLWSLAVIVFQCFTGKLPFESEALGDLLVKIIVAPVPVPSTLNPNVPRGFDAWFAKAAAREPEARFQTAKAFAESLSLALGFTALAGSPGVAGVASMRSSEISSPSFEDSGGFRTQLSGAQSTPQSVHSTPMSSEQGTLAGGHAVLAPAAAHSGPMGATFSGTLVPAGVPKKGSGMIIALAALGVLVVVGGGIGAVMALKHPATPIAAPSSEIVSVTSAHPTTSAGTSPSDPTAIAKPADTTLAGAGVETASTTATATTPSATATNTHGLTANGAAGVATHKNNGVAVPATNTTPRGKPPASSAPAGAPPTAPTSNKPDLGF